MSKKTFWAALPLLMLLCVGELPAQSMHYDLDKALQARRDSLIDYFADQVPADDYSHGGYIDIAAKLFRGKDLDWCVARLDTLMADPRGDMFWMYPFIEVTYAGKDILPADTRARMRSLWKTYHPYRGDTENHWAMYYTAMYLVTQMYPNEPGTEWFNGKSSTENFDEAEEYLISWMDLTTTIGQGEFDSPDYYGVYIIPMSQLYTWAKDPEMKIRAGMMLEWLLADFAAENLDGLYTGGHSRTYPDPVKNQWHTASTGISWLMFGNTTFYPRGENLILALSGFEPPEIIYHIATDRHAAYEHRELKRTRHRMRFSDVKNAPVYKTTYMRKEYAIGSLQGGLLQPIQQHTWDVTWALPHPQDAENTLFTIHPYSSYKELGMYFSWITGWLTEGVVRSKTTYDSPDKWTGGSPYEKVFQHEDALIVLYNIPEGTRYPHINGFFSRDLKERFEDESGWIFARGGDAYIGYYPLAPYVWEAEEDGSSRLHSTSLKNGAVVQVAPVSEFEGIDGFKRAVVSLPLMVSMDSVPSVDYVSLQGHRMSFTYGQVPTVDGLKLDYEHWPLFDGPYMHADRGSKKLELRYGKTHRVLDFNNLSVREWVDR